MLIVDASCLVEVLTRTSRSRGISQLMTDDRDFAAPHVIDVEVFGVVRQGFQAGRLDRTEARQAVDDLATWPGERFSHQPLLARAWELRDSVRGWDAMYVALAEVFDCPLITTDARLARAVGPRCEIRLV